VPAQLVQTRSVLLAADLATGVPLSQDVPRPFDAGAFAVPDAACDEPGCGAEHDDPKHREREPPKAAVIPVRAGDDRADLMESTHAGHGTGAAVPPQRSQGGTSSSSPRGTRILPEGDSATRSARYFPGTVRAIRRRQLLVDACIAGVVFAFSLAVLSHGGFDRTDQDLDVLGGVLAALAAFPLAARRLAPLPAFALATAATAALYGLRYGLGPPVAFAIALYSVAENRDETRPRTWAIALVASLVVLLAPHLLRDGFARELLFGAVVWAAAWFAGDRTRLRRERLAELEQRALRAEREAERERRLAAAEERTRIARDLHDSAGHAINVILVQAGAARLLQEQDLERSREALVTIEEVARDTLGEIDQLVRALRENGSPEGVEPPPGLAALETLAERYRGSGLAVTVRVDGSRRPLSPAADQAAYRILQEALTNAALHGRGSAEVEIAFGPSALEIAVTNPTAPGAGGRDGGGHGIVGMRERAHLLGGSIDAGASDGRFRVRARLPYAEASE
jgi:signal transduction histidine kinase